MLAIALLTVQVARRFHDTHFVSVFGENSKMDLTHYVVGFTHYTGCVAAILGEAPAFSALCKFLLFLQFREVVKVFFSGKTEASFARFVTVGLCSHCNFSVGLVAPVQSQRYSGKFETE